MCTNTWRKNHSFEGTIFIEQPHKGLPSDSIVRSNNTSLYSSKGIHSIRNNVSLQNSKTKNVHYKITWGCTYMSGRILGCPWPLVSRWLLVFLATKGFLRPRLPYNLCELCAACESYAKFATFATMRICDLVTYETYVDHEAFVAYATYATFRPLRPCELCDLVIYVRLCDLCFSFLEYKCCLVGCGSKPHFPGVLKRRWNKQINLPKLYFHAASINR